MIQEKELRQYLIEATKKWDLKNASSMPDGSQPVIVAAVRPHEEGLVL